MVPARRALCGLLILLALSLGLAARPTAGPPAFAAEKADDADEKRLEPPPLPPGAGPVDADSAGTDTADTARNATRTAVPDSTRNATRNATHGAAAPAKANATAGPAPSPAASPTASPAASSTAPPAAPPAAPHTSPASPASPATPAAAAAPFPDIRWISVAPGLELGLSRLPESRDQGAEAVLAVVRVDPARHRFALGMASETGQAHSLADWGRKAGMRAGINASMYLPDNRTSTGYMRNGDTLNNKAMGNKLGAFFVAGPRDGSGPPADIVERETPDWNARLDGYTIVVQNYRLVDSRGKVLWPAGGPMHSIAVVAKDDQGRIAFVLSQEPLTAERFAACLKALPLSLSTVMYVEGGAQAGLFLRVDSTAEKSLPPSFAGATSHPFPNGVIHVWKGRQSLLNTRGNPDAPVPNVIGIKGADAP